MKKVATLYFSFLFMLFMGGLEPLHSQAAYKIGVTLHRQTAQKATDLAPYLDRIAAEMASGKPHRTWQGGSLRALVQLEVSWTHTEPSPQKYDFRFYQDFARLCEQKGLYWSVLLSPHYLPEYIQTKYASDFITYADDSRVPEYDSFLRLSPSSAVWGNEIAEWIRAFIRAMQNDGGINHFATGTIGDLLLGNELMYPVTGKLSTFDNATQAAWRKFKNDPFAVLPRTIPPTTEVFTFRANELSNAIATMVTTADETLQALKVTNVAISSKTFSYYFPPRSTYSGWWGDQGAGYTATSVRKLDEVFRGVFATDSYPAKDAVPDMPAYFRTSAKLARTLVKRSLYISELMISESCHCGKPSQAEVYDMMMQGIRDYGVTMYSFYALNDERDYYRIDEAAMAGLKQVFDEVSAASVAIDLERPSTQPRLFEVFPNPAQSQVHIRLESATPHTTLTLFDLLGRKILEKTTSETSFTIEPNQYRLSAGVYWIQVNQGTKRQTHQVTLLR
ncbi:MAG: T9SS type A sorting domain-containing protein [Bacteroidetes Order II. Incertae sedis bacterium]|nr:T9SS type A sorting domain-containing protein [Bacteroidetes Order II. bacterium]